MQVVIWVKGSGFPGSHVQGHLLMSFRIQGIQLRGDGKDCAPLPPKEWWVRSASLAILFLDLELGEILHWERLELAFGGYRRRGYPSFAAAASAAATPRVDVEKGPQAAAAPGYVVASSQVPSRCLSEKHPVLLTMLVKRGKKRRSEKVMGTLFCWCVGCRRTRLWFGVDRGGRLLICLLLFGVALLFLFIFSTWWWRSE